jgi:hypothetical protein
LVFKCEKFIVLESKYNEKVSQYSPLSLNSPTLFTIIVAKEDEKATKNWDFLKFKIQDES